MKIVLNNIGKRFNRHWIFKNINYEFSSDHAYVILGANGSGKSTLLQVLAGNSIPSEGLISHFDKNGKISEEKIYTQVGISAPYSDLIEAYTLEEAIQFHFQFKEYYKGITKENILDILGLDNSRKKNIKDFSSGMKQRVKLALAVLSNSPFLFLDEPLSNLDRNGVEWYRQLMKNHTENRLIVVCSNQQKDEYDFCTKEFSVEDFK